MFLDSLRYIGIGLLLLILQFFLLEQINFGTWIQPMPYIYLIFILPFSMNRFVKLSIAFFLGFSLDSIGNTYGMHAAAASALCFVKIYADDWFLDKDAIQLQGFNYVTPAYKGNPFFIRYTLIYIYIHHLLFFVLDYFKWSSGFTILFVAALSSLITFLFILLFRLVNPNKT